MERLISEQLKKWKISPDRKPLVLKGARQVGKTYVLQAFGKEHFSRTFYINFEKQADFLPIFEKNLDPKRIITELSFEFKEQINIEQDLLIFDEIQACPKALNSLKYFCEDMPELALCAAGSLLGIHLNAEESFPVGKVDWLNMYPMTFEEFLMASEERLLLNLLQTIDPDTTIPEVAHQQLWELLKIYFVVGGLPAVVNVYFKNKDNLFTTLLSAREKQNHLINDYYADIAKHSGKVNAMHIDRVWKSVSTQLANTQNGRANKFRFKGVVPGIDRYQRLANVIDWLNNAGLLIKAELLTTCQQPLAAFVKESQFKLFMFDVGILGAMLDLSPSTIMKYDYGSYKGYFAENFVAQMLTASDSKPLYTWQEKTAELEFLKEINGEVIPIEVKAGKSLRAKSLKIFSDRYQPKMSVILSAENKKMDSKTRRAKIPLYFVSALKKIIISNI
ncbi:MAG: ATPase [Legionellaceae bacterium]|nr:ATPase [Legionellaceae bacterium]|tara:strand:- start:350 stop:1693 length:1344 start_codon:yes stop_codon:yes gene_type:complete